jgi:hypothetical protein
MAVTVIFLLSCVDVFLHVFFFFPIQKSFKNFSTKLFRANCAHFVNCVWLPPETEQPMFVGFLFSFVLVSFFHCILDSARR